MISFKEYLEENDSWKSGPKNPNGLSVHDSVNIAIRAHEYASDAADHVFGMHYYKKEHHKTWEQHRPHLIKHFKSYGLK